MNLIEGNYYEWIENGKNSILRVVKNKGNGLFELFFLLTSELKENDARFEKVGPSKLSITVCRKAEIKKPRNGENIFKEFTDNIENKFNSSVILNLNENESRYFLKGSFGKVEIKDDINDFFSKIEENLNISLDEKVKDIFLIEQFK